MAKDNIYDLIISELILRIAALTNAATTSLVVTNSIGSSQVQAGYSGTVTFTSEVYNMPTGYFVSGTTHTMTYPVAPFSESSSNDPFSGTPVAVSLALLGDTFVVNSTITLSHATDPDIILTGSNTITAVAAAYYGVLDVSAGLTITGLTAMASSSTQFQMTTSIVGRIYVVLPVGLSPLVSLTGPGGLVYTVASDFTLSTLASLDYYILNYDTQLTGTNVKTFTLNYA
jgi:hypothetical protein